MRLFQEHSGLIEEMAVSNHLTKIHHAKYTVGLMSENARKTWKIISFI